MRNAAFISWVSDPVCRSFDNAMQDLQKAWEGQEKTGQFGEKEQRRIAKAKDELLDAASALACCELSVCEEILHELIQILDHVVDNGSAPAFGSDCLSYSMVRLPTYVKLLANGAPNTPAALFDVLNCARIINGKAPRLADDWIRAISLDDITVPQGKQEFIEIAAPIIQYVREDLSPALESLLENDDVFFLLDGFEKHLVSLESVSLQRRLGLFFWLLRGLVSNTKARAQQADLLTVLCINYACGVFQSLVDSQEEAESGIEEDMLYLMVVLLAYAPTRSETAEGIVTCLGAKESLPDAKKVGEIRDQLGGANLSSLEDVYPLLVEELNKVIEKLNLATTSGRFNQAKIEAAFESILHVASTLEAIGDLSLSKLLRGPQRALAEALSNPEAVIEPALDGLTEGIFFTRKSLKNRMRGFAPDIFEDLPVDRETVYALIKEALIELRVIRKNLALHFETGEAHNELTQAVRSLASVSSGLTLVDLGTTSKALRYLAIYIFETIRSAGNIKEGELELVATALTAVEMRLEYYGKGLYPPESYNTAAEDALSALFGESYTETLPPIPAGLHKKESSEEFSTPSASFHPLARRILGVAESWNGALNKGWDGLRNLFVELGTIAGLADYSLIDRLVREFNEVAQAFRNTPDVTPDIAEAAFRYTYELATALVKATGKDADLSNESLSSVYTLREQLFALLSGSIGEVKEEQFGAGTSGDQEASAEQADKPAQEIDDDIDEELIQIFEKEFKNIAGQLKESLDDFVEEPISALPTESLIRAVHTLRGVSHTIDRPEMSGVYATWEGVFQDLASEGTVLSAKLIELFQETFARTERVVNGLRQGIRFEAASELSDAIAEEGDRVVQELYDQAGTTTARDLQSSKCDTEHSAHSVSGAGADAQPMPTELSIQQDEMGAAHEATEVPPEFEGEFEEHDGTYETEMLELYLEEADEELNRLEDLITELEGNPDDSELLLDIKRLMHTLKGSSNMAGAITIGQLTHELEDLMTEYELGSIKQSPLLARLLAAALDSLRWLTMLARKQETLQTPWNLFLCSRHAIDNGSINESELSQALKEAWSFTAKPQARPEAEPPVVLDAPDDEPEAARPVPTLSDRVEEDEAPPGANQRLSPEEGASEPKSAAPTAAPTGEDSFPGSDDKPRGPTVRRDPPKVKALNSKSFEVRKGETFEETVARLRSLRKEQSRDAQSGKATPPKIKVDTDLLDKLIDAAAAVNVDRDRIIHYREMMEREEIALRKLNDNLSHYIEGMFKILTTLDDYHVKHPAMLDTDYVDMFSVLQVTHQDLLETAGNFKVVQDSIKDQNAACRLTTRNMTKLTRVLRESLFDTRMVPMRNIISALRTTTRKTAEMVGKKADFRLTGERTKIDRNLLDSLISTRVFDHMIRNSVDHGIETPDERERLGKPAEGSIEMDARQDGDKVIITVKDDGAGIDPEKVRAKAIEKGIIDESAILSDSQILQLITESGFSTAAKVTQVSGRGVGMDVVKTTIEDLGGQMVVESSPGKGTAFVLQLPYTQGTSRALVVRVGDLHFAIPTQMIKTFAYLEQTEIGRSTVSIDGVEYPHVSLDDLCGLEATEGDWLPPRIPVIVIEYEDRPFAIRCSLVDGMQALHLKPAPAFKAELRGILGVADSIRGDLITVLDPRRLFESMIEHDGERYVAVAKFTRHPPRRNRPLALVVDDSIALRKSATRFLERMGYRVVQAVNGQDALDVLSEHSPAVIVTDLEMPRMDGFELTRTIRAGHHCSDVPIIMVTSRSTPAMEAEAIGCGVSCFLPKPFNPELLKKAIDTASLAEVR